MQLPTQLPTQRPLRVQNLRLAKQHYGQKRRALSRQHSGTTLAQTSRGGKYLAAASEEIIEETAIEETAIFEGRKQSAH